MSKKLNIILISLVLACNLRAQDFSSLIFPDKSITYLGQTGKNGKEHNGMGIIKLKNGGIYAGDFSHNLSHGYGIEIASHDKSIEKCENATIYVGKWFRGKKEGYGKLYNKSGDLIYAGKFSENTPIESLSGFNDNSQRFGFSKVEDDLYIGELTDSVPNGFGIILDEEGYISLTPTKNGNRDGISLMVLPPKQWAVFNIMDGMFTVIARSSDQEARRAEIQTNKQRDREQRRAELFNAFSGLLETGIQIADNINSIRDIKNSSSYSPSTNNEIGEMPTVPENYGGSKSSQKNNDSGFNLSERQSFLTDESTYHKYESMVIQAENGNRNASASELKNWKQKMKNIRKKWEKRGQTITKSSAED